MGVNMYKGIGPEKGKCIDEEFALGYAMQRIIENREEQQELVEWYFSGNWVKEDNNGERI